MQESRLFKIVYQLLEKGRATAPELAGKFEVSVRTIYRDIDALSAAGIPVYTEAGRSGGIRLMDSFVLDRAVLSEEEKQEVIAALRSIGASRGMHGTDTLSKIAALFDTGAESWIEVDFSRWGSHPGDNKKFEDLKAAVVQHKYVNITYAGSREIITKRKIEPIKLSYKSRAWYLKAYCTMRQEFRLFKLSRILDWEILKEFYIPRRFPKEPDSGQKDDMAVSLRFPGGMAYRVYDEFDPADVKQLGNGELLVSCQMPEDDWLTGFLLSFGDQVEVLEPARLRDLLASKAEAIYKKHRP